MCDREGAKVRNEINFSCGAHQSESQQVNINININIKKCKQINTRLCKNVDLNTLDRNINIYANSKQ